MEKTSYADRELLLTALALGLAGDLLLRAVPWGVNAAAWTLLVAAAAWVLEVRTRGTSAAAPWLILAASLSILFVWRASPLLHLGIVLAVTAALALALYRGQIHSASGGAPGFLPSSLRAIAGFPFFLMRAVRKSNRPGMKRTWAGVARGLLVAAPIVVVFGALLVSADATFERLVRQVFGSLFEDLPSHVALVLFTGGLTAVFLYGLVFRPSSVRFSAADASGARNDADESERMFALGVTEVSVALAIIDFLFAAFVIVQLPYLFGGASVVAATDSLTVAEYARRGFFELTVVAFLAVPVLLALHYLFHPESDRERTVFRVLALAQLLLLVVMLGSAVQRLWLYLESFGLTLDRVYACAVMIWLLFSFAWFAATVLRDRPRRFLPGAAAAGIAVIALLHVVNPTALVVTTNAARIQEGKSFDVEYATHLDADAVPALLRVLPHLPDTDQARLAHNLLERFSIDGGADIRTWNVARAGARRRVRESRPMLEPLAASYDALLQRNAQQQDGERAIPRR